jgi:hypothetical protein
MSYFVLQAKENGVFNKQVFKAGQYSGEKHAVDNLEDAFQLHTHSDIKIMLRAEWSKYTSFFKIIPIHVEIKMFMETSVRLMDKEIPKNV